MLYACVGPSIIVWLQTCGSGQDDFVDRQCAAHNSRRLRGRFFRWRAQRTGDSAIATTVNSRYKKHAGTWSNFSLSSSYPWLYNTTQARRDISKLFLLRGCPLTSGVTITRDQCSAFSSWRNPKKSCDRSMQIHQDLTKWGEAV